MAVSTNSRIAGAGVRFILVVEFLRSRDDVQEIQKRDQSRLSNGSDLDLFHSGEATESIYPLLKKL